MGSNAYTVCSRISYITTPIHHLLDVSVGSERFSDWRLRDAGELARLHAFHRQACRQGLPQAAPVRSHWMPPRRSRRGSAEFWPAVAAYRASEMQVGVCVSKRGSCRRRMAS